MAPYLVIGATDSRPFTPVAGHVYRFTAVKIGKGDPARVHGTGERLAVAEHHRSIRFYAQLLRGLEELDAAIQEAATLLPGLA